MKIAILVFFLFVCIEAMAGENIKYKNKEFEFCFKDIDRETKDKFGQEFFDQLKYTENSMKVYFNKILVPPFLRKNLRVKLKLQKNLEIGYIYEYKF